MSAVVGDFSKLDELISKCSELADPAVRRELSKDLAWEYVGFMTECFQESRSPYGEAWAPLSVRISTNGASQKPLLDTGIMSHAVNPAHISEDGFTVVVPQHYAETHQRGAEISAKNAKCLVFQGTRYTRSPGAKYASRDATTIFAKHVTIPPRPFALTGTIPGELADRFEEATVDFIETFFGSGDK